MSSETKYLLYDNDKTPLENLQIMGRKYLEPDDHKKYKSVVEAILALTNESDIKTTLEGIDVSETGFDRDERLIGMLRTWTLLHKENEAHIPDSLKPHASLVDISKFSILAAYKLSEFTADTTATSPTLTSGIFVTTFPPADSAPQLTALLRNLGPLELRLDAAKLKKAAPLELGN